MVDRAVNFESLPLVWGEGEKKQASTHIFNLITSNEQMPGPKRQAHAQGTHTLSQEQTRLFRQRPDYLETGKVKTTFFEL